MITPTHHEKAEWSRLATDAYRRDRNDVGHRFSVAASLPNGAQMAVKRFDSLQEQYRAWLLTGDLPEVPIPGRAAYEADVARAPCYGDGTPRRTWEQIDEIARWSWERNPTPRSTQEAR